MANHKIVKNDNNFFSLGDENLNVYFIVIVVRLKVTILRFPNVWLVYIQFPGEFRSDRLHKNVPNYHQPQSNYPYSFEYENKPILHHRSHVYLQSLINVCIWIVHNRKRVRDTLKSNFCFQFLCYCFLIFRNFFRVFSRACIYTFIFHKFIRNIYVTVYPLNFTSESDKSITT